MQDIDVRELYVPVMDLPELADYFRTYARPYADALARAGTGMITYVNLGEAEFVRGAAQALKAGYVMTIDYGGNWEASRKQAHAPTFERHHVRLKVW